MASPAVALIILNYNRRDDTLACLRSLQALSYPNARWLLVDNGSTDDSVERVRREFRNVDILETGDNLGFAAGNNVGLRAALDAGADYLLLLNNDTEVAPDLLDVLIETCEAEPRIGVVGPKIYYHDRPDTLWSAGGLIDWRRGTSAMRGLDEVDRGQFDASTDVDFVTGCALLVRRAAVEQAGLIDERFGMYFEETEWCVRIARGGWRIVYAPNGRLWHKIRPAQQDTSPRITYYMTRNRLLFLRLTNAPLRAWLHAILIQDLRTWLSWKVKPRWRYRAPQRAAMRRAWRDFIRQRFGMLALKV
ncbi:MAG TPA: glycosyltransferase family 2 protein [Anaerolineae bacterium]|nr:glycosyltransferase family 2 protein [Anaerolineae bacterium]